MKRRFVLKKEKCYLEIGDTLTEVKSLQNHCDFKECCIKNPIIQFEKNTLGNYYFSESLDLKVTGSPKIFSSLGEISYFPLSKCIGINIEDEVVTFGLPRFPIGKISTGLSPIYSFLAKEEAVFFWVYEFVARENFNKNKEN